MSRARFICLTVLAGLLLMPAAGLCASNGQTEWRVCVYNLADLNQPVIGSMNVEVAELLHGRRVSFEHAPCVARSEGTIYLLLRRQGPENETDALGRAPVFNGKVLRVLDVYVQPTLGLIGRMDSSTLIGRALARVAAHEVSHFIDQDLRHSGRGLMRSTFAGSDLISEDPYRFRRRND